MNYKYMRKEDKHNIKTSNNAITIQVFKKRFKNEIYQHTRVHAEHCITLISRAVNKC